jgi:hypothetical protein
MNCRMRRKTFMNPGKLTALKTTRRKDRPAALNPPATTPE